MEYLKAWMVPVSIACLPFVGACGIDDGQGPDDFGDLGFRDGVPADDRPPGGFINNGLHDPQVGGLNPAYSLDSDAGLDGDELGDPDRLATAQYVVECALPYGESITKEVDDEDVEFHGALGLAPQWQHEPCDEDCQQWVSACVLARTNVSGQTVMLWLQADHPALGTAPHPDYPHYEASFFGNLFVEPEESYLCIGPLDGPIFAQLDGRTCSNLEGGYCDFTAYVDCEVMERCEFVGGSTPTAIGCRPGLTPSGPPMHTISTYVSGPS